MTIKVVLLGYSGRMAKSNLAALLRNKQFVLSGVLAENDAFSSLGKVPQFAEITHGVPEQVKQAASSAPMASSMLALLIKIKEREEHLLQQALAPLVLVDFSLPHATLMHLKAAEEEIKKYQFPICWVIGTTGFSAAEEQQIERFATKMPIVKAGNFSVGINLLLKLVGDAAKILTKANIEIVETHHRGKVDAPSGTAIMLAQAVKDARSTKLNLDRFQKKVARTDDEIGFASLRGGSVIGWHEVQFLGLDESIFLGHRAENRALFSSGALVAALWLANKANMQAKEKQPLCLYSMADVLQAMT